MISNSNITAIIVCLFICLLLFICVVIYYIYQHQDTEHNIACINLRISENETHAMVQTAQATVIVAEKEAETKIELAKLQIDQHNVK